MATSSWPCSEFAWRSNMAAKTWPCHPGRQLIRGVLAIAAICACLNAASAEFPKNDSFFPEGVFDSEDQERDKSERAWYSRSLRANGETSLWVLSKDRPDAYCFRLLWRDDHQPPVTTLRIVPSDGSAVLHVERTDPKTNGGGRGTAVKKKVKLTEEEWTWVQVFLERSRFWKLKSLSERDDKVGCGDELLLEGAKDGKYHVVARRQFDDNPEYAKLCWFLLELSGIDFQTIWAQFHDEVILDEGVPRRKRS